MSSTNRGSDRIKNDAYYTPPAVAEACVATLPSLAGLNVVEPSIGRGAFAEACIRAGAYVSGVDIDPDCPASDWMPVTICDFVDWSPGGNRVDWFIGNPPYKAAEEHVRHALEHAERGCAFLLRLAFLESVKRRPFWEEHPPSEVWVLDKRPSFTEDGKSDSAAYAWFVWFTDRKHRGTRLDWLRWAL